MLQNRADGVRISLNVRRKDTCSAFVNQSGGTLLRRRIVSRGCESPMSLRLAILLAASALLYSGLFYLCGIAGVLYSGYSSDRSGNHKWHCVASQIATGLLLGASTIPGQPFGAVMIWLCLTGLVVYSWPSPFWALPTATLTSSAAAASIGLINMFANVAGYLGNHVFGLLRSRGMTDGGGLLLLAGCYLVGGAIVSRVRLARE